MFSKTQLALLIGAVLTVPAAYAETTQVDEHMVVTGRGHGYKADNNTTAMKIEATQLETPGQVTVIDEQIIDEQRASSLGEVLKNDASVSAGGDSRNRERFSLRGFEIGSSSGFLRDGKQHWSHYRQPVELLERVEVLKGPAGLLYGKSAPGGLINMVSKKPTYETQVSLSQDIGSNNDSRTVLDVSGALNEDETLRARTVLSKQTKESWRSYSDGSTHSTERVVGGVFVDYDLNNDITVSVHADKTKDHGNVDSGAYVVDGKVIGGDERIWDAQWSKIENDVENYGFDVNAQLSTNWALKTGYNYQDFKRNDVESFPDFSKYATNGTIGHGGSDRKDHWVFQTAYVDFTGEANVLGMDHQLLLGANWLGYDYKRNQASFTKVYVEPGNPVPTPEINTSKKVKKSHSHTDSYGIYVQDMVTITDQWKALAGVRFDEQRGNGIKETAVSPKAAIIYQPVENGSIYVNYSESFEPKGQVSNSSSRQYVNDGEQLKPVKGKQYELGTKWELFDNSLFVSGAVFDITEVNSPLDVELSSGKWKKTQDGERVHRGAELAAQGNVTEDLSLSASAMYLDAEYTKHETYQGNRPVDVPEFSASVWSRYSFVTGTDMNLGVIYVGERFGDAANTFQKDSYTRVDLGVAHTYKYDEKLDIVARLNVENLFDTDYLAGGGSTSSKYPGATNVVIGEGRNFMASIQFRY
ncbi:TonB-dependent siderophore receptor [Photobacterium sanguinicancri]|uniref:TonB-dependent siderophore receptor n=1 Tax=Photobacterium sanguinicancri TaxID=875932 RepID=A0ABX4FRF5_9GAMM|nr:TonB-dependent siderophore receptor [Photobacterium sanguinicancri]OZS41478.1 TonB-dependent siderophore receptor [Photobacterium sanguinicancri]